MKLYWYTILENLQDRNGEPARYMSNHRSLPVIVSITWPMVFAASVSAEPTKAALCFWNTAHGRGAVGCGCWLMARRDTTCSTLPLRLALRLAA